MLVAAALALMGVAEDATRSGLAAGREVGFARGLWMALGLSLLGVARYAARGAAGPVDVAVRVVAAWALGAIAFAAMVWTLELAVVRPFDPSDGVIALVLLLSSAGFAWLARPRRLRSR